MPGPAPALLPLAGVLGIAGGVCLVLDSLAVDLFGTESSGPNTLGVLVPVFGTFLIVGLFAAVRATAPTRLLDWGFALNLVGLTLVAGVDFARTYVFAAMDDDAVDALLESGPTKPAFITAGTVFVLGAVLFGAALIRAGHAPRASWLYTLTAAPSGFASLLPDVPGAIAQAAAGAAIVALGWSLRTPSPRPAVRAASR
ncbi:hypothetical protein OG216_15475 [Streptomycetaceae bacterium NBC_01309]